MVKKTCSKAKSNLIRKKSNFKSPNVLRKKFNFKSPSLLIPNTVELPHVSTSLYAPLLQNRWWSSTQGPNEEAIWSYWNSLRLNWRSRQKEIVSCIARLCVRDITEDGRRTRETSQSSTKRRQIRGSWSSIWCGRQTKTKDQIANSARR